jgi:hypothetical protein
LCKTSHNYEILKELRFFGKNDKTSQIKKGLRHISVQKIDTYKLRAFAAGTNKAGGPGQAGRPGQLMCRL